MRTAPRPTVVIFCDHLLYLSETFIRAQGQALRQYLPAFAGSRRVAGLELPASSCYTINPGTTAGKVREVAFKLFGKAPDLVRRLACSRSGSGSCPFRPRRPAGSAPVAGAWPASHRDLSRIGCHRAQSTARRGRIRTPSLSGSQRHAAARGFVVSGGL